MTLRHGQIGETVCTETFHLWGLPQFHVFAEARRFRRLHISMCVLFPSSKVDAIKASFNCHFAVCEPQQSKLMKTPTGKGTHSAERGSRPGLCAEAQGQGFSPSALLTLWAG